MGRYSCESHKSRRDGHGRCDSGSGASASGAEGLAGGDFFKNVIEVVGDFPVGVMGLEFGEIGDVADVVADAVLLDIVPVEFLARELFGAFDGFDHGDTVSAAATHVVDLPGAGTSGKLFDSANYVVAVNVVADLFSFVAEDGVAPARESLLDEIGEEAVELDAGVGRPGETAAAENADVHLEIAAVFLGDEISSSFRSAK